MSDGKLKEFIGLNLNTLLTASVGAAVIWMASEVKNTAQTVIRLEALHEARSEQLKRMDVMMGAIMPRSEIESKLLEIKTDLSQQRIETSRLNLEVEKIKLLHANKQ